MCDLVFSDLNCNLFIYVKRCQCFGLVGLHPDRVCWIDAIWDSSLKIVNFIELIRINNHSYWHVTLSVFKACPSYLFPLCDRYLLHSTTYSCLCIWLYSHIYTCIHQPMTTSKNASIPTERLNRVVWESFLPH